MTSDKLKPCPFCGAGEGECHGQNLNHTYKVKYAVYCNHENGCPLDGEPCGAFETKAEAIAAWNRRADAKKQN